MVDDYLAEAKAAKIRTLEELNRRWDIFLNECYHRKPHEGIREYYESQNVPVPKEGITPEQEFNRDLRPLKFLDAGVVGEALLYHEKRKVDKGACISFRGKRYETKASLIGSKVEISYDPASPELITVSHPGLAPFTARPLRVGEYCYPKQPLPVSMLAAEPESSRFLDALEQRHKETVKRRADAISFGGYRKDVAPDV